MATEPNEVKDVERVEIEPTKDDELVEGQEPSPVEEEAEEGEKEPEAKTEEVEAEGEKEPEAVETTKEPKPAGTETDVVLADGRTETPTERALRIQLVNVRSKLKGEKKQELFDISSRNPAPAKAEPANEVLKKYKPEEVEAFKDLAKTLGFVQQNEIQESTYKEKADEVFDAFIEKHPEYTAENDPKGELWSALSAEFALFAKPTNPRDYAKILERSHKAVFNVKPAAQLNKQIAAKEKVKVASHSGASRVTKNEQLVRSAPGSLRTDMLKGFTDEEKADIENSA